MPKTPKGKKISRKMKETYRLKKGEEVFYASANKGCRCPVQDTIASVYAYNPSDTPLAHVVQRLANHAQNQKG